MISASVLALAASPALAQDRSATTADGEIVEEVVVTGTLIRGIAPTGTNVIDVGREEIVSIGAVSANDLLATIPQIGNFGTIPAGSAGFGNPIVRPNIRNLGGSGGSTTLVLMNGHRLVGAGVLQTSPDPSIIPPGVIDRVEVIPDGGSSIYGSDAIGGVINFITRKRFQGLEATARYGVADDYETIDANLTAGTEWTGGSALISYAYAWHDNIQGLDRDYVTADNTAKGGTDLRSTACAPGNISIGDATFALPGRLLGTLNRCDPTDYADIYPREERHTVFAAGQQQLADNLDFEITGYWSRRATTTLSAQGNTSGVITAANPYFRPVLGEPAHSVAFAFDDVFGKSAKSKATFESYGVTPLLIYRFGKDWRLQGQVNLGRSENEVHEGAINASAASVALAGTTLDTALNPYDPRASSAAVLSAIGDFENYGGATQDMAEFRLVADGPLMTLPGGDLRLALGAEHHYESIDSVVSLDRRDVRTSATYASASRRVNSVFAELFVPIVGDDNGRPGLRAFDISASARFDDYSDVGSTTNPKIGFNYRPFEDIKVRANYGTSFHAPSLADTTNSVDARVQILPISPFRPPTSPPTDLLRPTIVLAGGNSDLKPETADTWSLGVDWTPQQIPGFTASATYYNVKFEEAIGLVPATSPVMFSDPNFASFYVIDPTLEQVKAAVGSLPLNGAPSIESLFVGRSPFILIDARRNNLGAINIDGIDFNLNYARPTSFGAVTANLAGTYTLNREMQTIKGGDWTNQLQNGNGRWAVVASAAVKYGDLSARAAVNYRDSYPVLGYVNQTKIDAFTTVDLFVGYDLEGWGPADNFMLTLNIDNLFDEDPPYSNTSIGYANGSTLGRLVSVGLRARF
ncbi:TonB-dependent receptor [Phenylobacterium sp.]|uniref:TonB-dependent receptor n=1 Tax=Phenylobacterium sp. TaxID=1871053 RepID=UPI002896AD6A|nr:TonB-dependent receptor [Phenylobacterium sp.]